MDKINTLLTTWSNRDLSLYGKVQILKTFAVSQLVLPASLLPIPEGIVEKINSLFFKFLWNTNDKIQRIKLIKPSSQGGINMIDIDSLFKSLKAIWVLRIAAANAVEDNWVRLSNYFLGKLADINSVILFSIDKSCDFPCLKRLHPFYKEIVYSYGLCNGANSDNCVTCVSNQSLWGNKLFCINIGRKKMFCICVIGYVVGLEK